MFLFSRCSIFLLFFILGSPNLLASEIASSSKEKQYNFRLLETSIEEFMKAKEIESLRYKNICFRAFPNEKFCHCLIENLPLCVNFHTYIEVVNSADHFDLGVFWVSNCMENNEIEERYGKLGNNKIAIKEQVTLDGMKFKRNIENTRDRCLN
jgi:hypothetical protein